LAYRRAMHFSAKRCIAIACRPSVRMTLVDQDHIRWKSWKLIARMPNTFALRSPKAIHLLPEEHGEVWGRLEVGWEKVACWSTKALKRVPVGLKIDEKLLWTMERRLITNALSNGILSLTPYGLLFPKIGFATPINPKLQSLRKG